MLQTLQKSLLAGLAATVVMTMVTMVAPYMGLPPMSAPDMLSGMMGLPTIVGWGAHFMIGVIFALSYAFLFLDRVKLANIVVKGAVFGFAVFIIAQIAMVMMGAIFGPMPAPEGSMALLMIGSIMGHVIYGIVVALIARPATLQTA